MLVRGIVREETTRPGRETTAGLLAILGGSAALIGATAVGGAAETPLRAAGIVLDLVGTGLVVSGLVRHADRFGGRRRVVTVLAGVAAAVLALALLVYGAIR